MNSLRGNSLKSVTESLRENMLSKVYINHIAAFLPHPPVDNETMETVLGQIGERASRVRKIILRSNQITSRHYALDPRIGAVTHTNAELAAAAVRALGRQGCPLQDIELLACGTSLPDQLLPNHALMVHGELGLPPCEAVATAGICLAGTMALKYAYLSILAGQKKNAVATASENVSSLLRGLNFTEEIEARAAQLEKQPAIAFEKDFLRWMLSDGAGALWLSPQPEGDAISLRIDWIFQKSYTGELETCMYAGAEKTTSGRLKGWREYAPQAWLERSIFSIKQDVKLLNDKIIEYTVVRPLRELSRQVLVEADQIDWFLPHYSSGFFRDPVRAGLQAAGCDIPQER